MQGPAEHSVKAKKSYKADMSVAEHENDLEPYGTKIDSKRDIKSYASKKRMQNYSEQKISFDSKSVNQLHKRPSQKQYKKYISREESQDKFIDKTLETEEEHDNNAGSFGVPNNVGHYYHNAKALENVLKEDKDAITKRHKERQQILDRKQKVASYSKLVKEIHWDSNGEQNKKRVDYKPMRNPLKSDNDSNKTFDQQRKYKMSALERVKDFRRKHSNQLKVKEEQGEMTSNFGIDSVDESRNIRVSKHPHNKSTQGLSAHGDHHSDSNQPRSSKNVNERNFVGLSKSNFTILI
jgi:hypothetical protein